MNAHEFKNLFLPYHQELFALARRLLGNTQDAEDVLQEAYLKLWTKRSELRELTQPRPYCIKLVRNLCLDRIRNTRWEDVGESPENLSHDTAHDVSHHIEMHNEAEWVSALIKELPPNQKQVIEMRDLCECSYQEIEQATGLAPTHIRVLLSRARKNIREQFYKLTKHENR